MNQWRVGRKVPINVYDGDVPVCQCQTAKYAQLIVKAVNGYMDSVGVRQPQPKPSPKPLDVRAVPLGGVGKVSVR